MFVFLSGIDIAYGAPSQMQTDVGFTPKQEIHRRGDMAMRQFYAAYADHMASQP